jgi:hypothetical protein
MIPIARYSAVSFGIGALMFLLAYNSFASGSDGIKPRMISCNCGLASMMLIRKQTPMIAMRAMINASIFRMPNLCRYNKRKVSSTVMETPQISGRPVSNWIPMAMPSTSARSVAAIAISASSQSTKLMYFG